MISSKIFLTKIKKQITLLANCRKRLVAAAEELLAGIHGGNFARYRVRPSEFEA